MRRVVIPRLTSWVIIGGSLSANQRTYNPVLFDRGNLLTIPSKHPYCKVSGEIS